MPKSGNFATKVPKEANANGRLSVVSKTENYENQTSKIHISSGAENNATATLLKNKLSNEMLNSQGIKPNEVKVIARGDINGHIYIDTNQKARANIFADPSKPTLINQEISHKKTLASGGTYPNGDMANAHAEIGVIQQAYEKGITKGKHLTIQVQGQDVCGYCVRDIALAAEKSGLKSLQVEVIDKNNVSKVYTWKPGNKSIKEVKFEK